MIPRDAIDWIKDRMLCLNCKTPRKTHVDDKCIFGPAYYAVLSLWVGAPNDYLYLPALRIRRWACAYCGVVNDFVAKNDQPKAVTHCRQCAACNHVS